MNSDGASTGLNLPIENVDHIMEWVIHKAKHYGDQNESMGFNYYDQKLAAIITPPCFLFVSIS